MHSPVTPRAAEASATSPFPDNPVLAQVWRADFVESQHRGAWVLVDAAGAVIDGAGSFGHPIFARSSVKSLQALPLLESGAAERFGFGDDEVALALASHNGESIHTERVERLLARLGLSVADLRCGPQPPSDPKARAELERRGDKPTAAHNNCSGKHAGFLALARHLGEPTARYLDPESGVQQRARAALCEMSDVQPGELSTAIDGCSAPTFRLPLTCLATAIARVANPEGLAAPRRRALERMHGAVAAYPELIAGSHRRICTQIVRASGGRLFPKVGGEAVYVVGVRGAGVGLAVKMDDGDTRGLHPVVIELLRRKGFLAASEVESLREWTHHVVRNWAGIAVGRLEVAP